MKNISKYAIIAASVSLFGCTEDFLTQDIKGTQVLDNYFTTKEECLASVYGCYYSLAFDDWWQVYNMYALADMCTDDGWMNNTTQSTEDYIDLVLYQGKTTNGPLSNYWQFRYKGIHNCNVVIEYVSKVSSLSEADKNRYIAEAKALRGYFYFELVRNFGGVPLVTTMATPEDAKSMTRASLADTYAQIEKDYKEAILYLPTRSETVKNAEIGRITKGAVQGLLAKALLYQEKYSEAKKYLDEVISSGEYALMPNFSQVWDIDYNNSEESLFEIQTNNNTTYKVGQMISVVEGSRDDKGWSWFGPSSELENAFVEAGDDIRLFYTIIKHNATELPHETQMELVEYKDENGNVVKGKYGILPSKHKSSRINGKLYIPLAKRPEPYDANHNILNYRLLRYADVLLMAAEVENALGNDTKAQGYLNQVRNRVDLDNVTATGTQLRDAIRNERRLELACEGNRLYDIRRWTCDNGKKMACNLFGPNGSWVIYNTKISTDPYETTNLIEPQDEGINFNENRDLLFPIPNAEVIQSNGMLEQNPGY